MKYFAAVAAPSVEAQQGVGFCGSMLLRHCLRRKGIGSYGTLPGGQFGNNLREVGEHHGLVGDALRLRRNARASCLTGGTSTTRHRAIMYVVLPDDAAFS